MKITRRASSMMTNWRTTEDRRNRADWFDGRHGIFRAENRLPRHDGVDVNRRLI